MKRQEFVTGVLAAMIASGLALSASAQPVTMTVGVWNPGAPITKYMYGFFTELLSNCYEGGMWSEMLGDRKFFYPVDSSKEQTPPKQQEIRGTVEARGSGRIHSDGPFRRCGAWTRPSRLWLQATRGLC